jgi:hypothetical protein
VRILIKSVNCCNEKKEKARDYMMNILSQISALFGTNSKKQQTNTIDKRKIEFIV